MKAAIALVLAGSVAVADPPNTVRVDPPPGARAQAITATVVTGILLGGAVFSSLRATQKTQETNELAASHAPPEQWAASNSSTDHWHDVSYGLIGATLVSVGVSAYLWTRVEPRYLVVPAAGGAMVGFTSSW